ncbi:hypothetical protein HDV02_003166 [Globomyces sp. JEL0801]|nr:hypothetical protein HDV02_003166 [Globomyces sp. JEL0801]
MFIQLSEPSRFISINSKELDISSVSVVAMRVNPGGLSRVDSWPKCVTTHRATQKATGITYNTDEETATFEFEHEIPAVSDLVLHLYFEGVHNNQMAGFYRSAYKNANGESKFMVTTQFEPSDCRRCFPCFDEPNLKATFDMTLYVPQELTALSNMNAVEESIVEFNGKTFKSVKFARTPIMSTYLVAICVGEYDYIEAVAHPKQPVGSDPITCRVYTLPGESQNGKFA